MIDYEVHLEQLAASLEYQLEDREIKLARAVGDNDQLKARVMELEEGAKGLLEVEMFAGHRHRAMQELLNRTPAQSLALLKAEVLEDVAEIAGSGKAYNHCEYFSVDGDWLRHRAAQLRKEAGE